MKKLSIFRFIASLSLLLTGVFVSCDDNDSIEQTTSPRVEVSPSTDIAFKADGNQDILLTVQTNAESWTLERPTWLIARKDGNKLKVNAQINTHEAQRPGRLTIKAPGAAPVKINILQDGLAVGETYLGVTPAEELKFEAAANAPVTLGVQTNAKEWSVSHPEWISVRKESDKIIVTATDNTGEARLGVLAVKTDDGEKTVKLGIAQKGVNDAPDTQRINCSISTDKEVNLKFDQTNIQPIVKTVTVQLEKAAETDMQLNLVLDEQHIADYNYAHNTRYEIYPVELCTIANNGEVVIPAGETTATADITITFSNEINFMTEYMIPVKAEAVSEGLNMLYNGTYVEYFFKRGNDKPIRNICYFEVNDCNPLNATEYVLMDGRPFFDAVVLFAGNINWDRHSERVVMQANPNVQALLDGTDTFLQPLRKMGIKVLLCILGNHDAAGLAGLTDYGCQEFGKELARICRDYKLDGVAFDDEYSSYSGRSTKWFIGGANQRQAARLCYETKKAMRETCPWETWLHLYYLGNIWPSLPSVTIDGVEHQAGEFVDNVCADYGQAAAPVRGMDLSGCSGMSFQLNSGQAGELTEAGAKQYMDKGYGWIMWFAFDPSGSGSVGQNYSYSLRQFNNMAKGCYGQHLREPKYVYHKIRSGEYDPEPHPLR